jgi:cell division protein FtsW (lipid II flippase)
VSPRAWFRSRGVDAEGAPIGVPVRLRAHNLPGAERTGRVLPGWVWWGLLISTVFYVVAHASVVIGVWPVHGTAAGAGGLLVRNLLTLGAWFLMLLALRWLGYRGSWAIVVLPIVIFMMARPALFQVFSDPAYQARGAARVEANQAKAERARLSTIERVYGAERREIVFDGPPPPKPDPFARAMREEARATAGAFPRLAAHFSVFIAPLALLGGFLIARERGVLRWVRNHRLVPFVPVWLLFFVLTAFFTPRATGKVAGTTPWELFLPVFVIVWAATLAEDAYNLSRPGAVAEPRRLANLFLFGALPLVPFLIIRELGLSVVLAGTLAAMLLVGTRRGWWAGLMLVVWGVLVFAAFNLDDRSAARLDLAYSPYKDVASMSEEQAASWAALLHQMKLFDANVIAGGVLGEGAGRGHGETAPNAADDGFITLFAAQWGLLGGVTLVLVYTLFLVHLLAAATRERGAFERTMLTGIAMLLAIPFWQAVLGGVRVVPLTGVAAAFAAHGGAKLLASSLAVGLAAGITHLRARDELLDEAVAAPAAESRAKGVRIR